MSRDADYNRMIHSAQWLRLRHEVLEAHPICQVCEREGRMRMAEEVHHINPVEAALSYREREVRMFDRLNLQALCHKCHTNIHRQARSKSKDGTKARQADLLKQFKEKFS